MHAAGNHQELAIYEFWKFCWKLHVRLKWSDSATIVIRVATPEDGRMWPKHVVEEYVYGIEDKIKNVVFGRYKRLSTVD
jgi:hypothetical protein